MYVHERLVTMRDANELSGSAYEALLKTGEYKDLRRRYYISIALAVAIWASFMYFSANFLGFVSYLKPSTSIALTCLAIVFNIFVKELIGTPCDVSENIRTLFLKTLVEGGHEIKKPQHNQE